MSRFLSPTWLAGASARRPWLTIGAWLVVVAIAVGGASMLKFQDSQRIPGSESDRAYEILTELRGPQPITETVVISSETLTVDSPEYRAAVEALVADLRSNGLVKDVTTFYETENAALVSEDGRKMVIPVVLHDDETAAEEGIGDFMHILEANSTESIAANTVGRFSSMHEFNETAQHDLEKSEMIGLPAALLVLFVVFGAAVAAGLPVVLGIVGIVLAAGVTGFVSRFLNISSYSLNMVTMIGLAVGIDYTLFIVERFREERANGLGKLAAIERSGNTASRAVLFSGITVIVAMSGLLIVPDEANIGLVVGAISVVFAAVAIALTLLPATLSLLGDRVNWGSLPGRKARKSDANPNGAFARLTAFVQRHPAISAISATAILVAATLPLFGIRLGYSNMDEMPEHLSTVTAYHILQEDFSAGQVDPLEVAIRGDIRSEAVTNAIADFRAAAAADGNVASVGELQTNDAGQVGLIQVVLGDQASGDAANHSVERLRDMAASSFAGTGAEVKIGAGAAVTLDYVDSYVKYLPYVIGFVLLLSFVLLTMVFRSIVIPVKAIIMNLLSVGAAYGLLVLVFQEGVGADLFGFTQTESITAFLPIFLFAVLFGLSMDYHVFLLSRIHERYMETHDNTAAVGYGLRSTAHIITGAAAIMMVVFGGFAAGDLAPVQQVGFGLAVAVFLDGTIVRSVLVPSSMQLLGDKNWYFPSWLEWLPQIHVEGAPEPAHPVAEAPAGGLMPLPGVGGGQ